MVGVPRIEQIINNTEKIKTPIIMAKLDVDHCMDFAKEVGSKIEKTTLGEGMILKFNSDSSFEYKFIF